MLLLMSLASVTCGGGAPTAAPSAPAPAPAPTASPAPVVPLKPQDGFTVTITSAGFRLNSPSSAGFTVDALRLYQGAQLIFINNDTEPHDVLSDPPHIHTDCPEINAAGYLVPGQARGTDPLNRIMTCGFHDHTHEGEAAFAGKVTIEAR